jgi:NADPH:quinone reductase-like Zn-dependent oxidoreductase
MKAAVLHEYGPPKNLKYEDFPDPKPGPGEVLVRVHAASLNPVDWKMRSGAAKDRFPVEFPAVLGRDMAGLVVETGEHVTDFTAGERVFALTWHTYAELCVVKAADLAKVPENLELTSGAAVPLVSVTGDQLIRIAANVQPGQTVLLTGALGSVGRCALYSALELGAKVIAGVRRKQVEEAVALGATAAIDLADEKELARLGVIDAVADTIGGPLAPKLLAKIKPGGHYGSIVGPPKDAALHPTININAYMAHPDTGTIVHFGEALRDGKLKLPIDRMMPLAEAAEAHVAGERGGIGKIILLA